MYQNLKVDLEGGHVQSACRAEVWIIGLRALAMELMSEVRVWGLCVAGQLAALIPRWYNRISFWSGYSSVSLSGGFMLVMAIGYLSGKDPWCSCRAVCLGSVPMHTMWLFALKASGSLWVLWGLLRSSAEKAAEVFHRAAFLEDFRGPPWSLHWVPNGIPKGHWEPPWHLLHGWYRYLLSFFVPSSH